MAAKWIEALTGSLEQKKQYRQDKARIDALPEPYANGGEGMHRYFMYYGGVTDGDTLMHDVRATSPTSGSAPPSTARPCATSSATTRSSSPRPSRRPTPAGSGSTRSAARLTKAIDDADRRPRRRRPMTTDQVREPAIRVQGIEKSFKDLHVLRGVDFDVAAGSIFALLGSNGAGKTTLVRILSTLLKADAGTATVHGFDVATEPADVRESISLTGQFAAVDEVLTGRENLVLVAKLRHLKNPGAIADDLLARFSLTDAGDRKAGDLLGRHATPARHRDEPDRQPAGHLPRRADHRPRPAGAHRGVADRQGARQRRHDRAAHHAVPRRGRAARRPHRDPARGHASSRTAPSPNSSSSSRPPRSSTSRSSPPSRTSSSPSSARRARPTPAATTPSTGTERKLR